MNVLRKIDADARFTPFGLKISILSFICVAVMYIDRAIIANAIIPIRVDIHASDRVESFIFSAFAWGYVLGMPAAGYLGSRYPPRIVVAAAGILWALSMILTATSHDYHHLIGSRVMLGFSEAPVFPCLARLVAETVPSGQRTRATAFFDSGSYFGPMIGAPGFVFFAYHAGWRISLGLLAMLSAAFAVVWWLFLSRPDYRSVSPARHPDFLTSLRVCADPRLLLVSAGFFAYNCKESIFYMVTGSYSL